MMHATFPNKISRAIELPAFLPKLPAQSDRRRYESESARALLQNNGWDAIEKLFALADHSLHGHKRRAVSRVELSRPNGEMVSAYVKLNWGRRRLVPRMTDIKTRQAFQNLPEREWRGIGELRSLGFHVPERLALFQRGWLWFQEAVVIQSVRPPLSLDEMIRTGRFQALAKDRQQAILEGVVDVMQRLHQAGLGWRGTCTRHFFPEETHNGSWRFWLIDCEGIHRGLTRKNIARDYRKLNKAMSISGPGGETLRAFQQLTDRAQTRSGASKSRRIEPLPLATLNPALEPSL